MEAINDYLPFLFGYVKGLVHFIGEERVLFDVFSERCPPNQIRMKDNADGGGPGIFLQLHADYLSRSKTDNCPFLIIILFFPIFKVSAFVSTFIILSIMLKDICMYLLSVYWMFAPCCNLYSFGVHPMRFLNSRLRCWGY